MKYPTQALLILVAVARATSVELVVSEPEKVCTLAEIRAEKCRLKLSGKGATYLAVNGRVADGPAANRLTTPEVTISDGSAAELTVRLSDGDLSGPWPLVVTVSIDSKIGTVAQPPKSVKLTIPNPDDSISVLNGKPVALLFMRRWREEPESILSIPLRRGENGGQPSLSAVEFYRTIGEETYPIAGKIKDPVIAGSGTALTLGGVATLPRGNYNAAAGMLLVRSASGKDILVPILCRIKDHWWMPVWALLLGHFLILCLRKFGVQRPVKVLMLRILTNEEAVRSFEQANPNPSDGDKARLRTIKTLLAAARRMMAIGELGPATQQLIEMEKLLSTMEGHPGSDWKAPQAASVPELFSVKGLKAQIQASDFAVEMIALGISLALGAAIYFEADRFGTYNDYLKLFLFAFGISASAQGFVPVLEQLKTGKAPGAG